MSDCEHLNFSADVKVGRLTENEGGSVNNFVADISIKCIECGVPFHFLGINAGFSYLNPTRDVDGTTLHAPIAPGEVPWPAVGRLVFDLRGGGKGQQ